MFKNKVLLFGIWIIPIILLFYSFNAWFHINRIHTIASTATAQYHAALEAHKNGNDDTFLWNEKKHSVSDIVNLYEAVKETHPYYFSVVNTEYALAIFSCLFSVIAFFSGVLSQRLCIRVRKLNEEDLTLEENASLFHWFRNIIALSATAHCFFSLLTAIALLVFKMIWFGWHVKAVSNHYALFLTGEIITALVIVGLGVLLWHVKDCIKLFTICEPLRYGINLAKNHEQKFWSWLEKTTQEQNLPLPDNVALSLQKTCYATREPLQLAQGDKLEGLTLCVPVRQIASLNKHRMQALLVKALENIDAPQPAEDHDLLEMHARIAYWLRNPPCHGIREKIYRVVTCVAAPLADHFLHSYTPLIHKEASGQIWAVSHLLIKADNSHAAALINGLHLHISTITSQLPHASLPA
ncbi:hypothetical protein [Superficieibacter sp. HKU1]|uniref:hypothetical protein n=1 Tax=Superficieibacter sp. HKU1 TaxID=3031919 RepID=UPI0023E14103|nr:hypothetical protein [Superficieibacter sp. HKU1]WES67057.1 hypothetical protein P0H77_15600 [Superficieibacter sp. HKU1]